MDGTAATWVVVLLATVVVLLATVRRVGTGLAMAVCVVRVTVRVFTVVAAGAGEASLVVAAVLAAGAAGVTSVTGGGAELGACCVVAVVGSVVTGGAVCAAKGVEESARTAAIAGRALAGA